MADQEKLNIVIDMLLYCICGQKKKKRKEKILIYIPADSPRGSIGILIPNNILLQRTETTASPYSATELSVLPTATSTHRHEMTGPHLAVAGFTPL